jgi:hypothetical protein
MLAGSEAGCEDAAASASSGAMASVNLSKMATGINLP